MVSRCLEKDRARGGSCGNERGSATRRAPNPIRNLRIDGKYALYVAAVRLEGAGDVPVVPAEQVGDAARHPVGALSAMVPGLEREVRAAEEQVGDRVCHLVFHGVPHLTDRVGKTRETLTTVRFRNLVHACRPAASVRANEMIGQLRIGSRALGGGNGFVDVREVTAGEGRVQCRRATRDARAELLGDGVHDLGGHDAIGRELAAGNGDVAGAALLYGWLA